MSSVAEKLAQEVDHAPGAAKQVRLKLVYIDFWSAVKLSFLVAVCLGDRRRRRRPSWSGSCSTRPGSSTQVEQRCSRTSPAANRPHVRILGLGAGDGLLARRRDPQHRSSITALGAIFALLYNLSVKITGGLLVGFTNN